MTRFNFDTFKKQRDGGFWLDLDDDKQLKKVCIGDTAKRIEEIFNSLYVRNEGDFEKTKSFVERARAELAAYGTEITACADTNEAIKDADLVTLVTVSATPVCSAEYFKPGCTISAVGAYTYDMQELDPAVFAKCGKLYFDSEDAVLSESGDILRPLDEGLLSKDQFTGDIGDYILGKIPGRESDEEIIVFENVGIGALDLMTADRIFKKASEAGIGTVWE
jgi:ornithine cyclodeaminase